MDTAPLVAALTSVLAIGLTIVLLRIVRQDRQRSEARVSALISMAAAPAYAPAFAPAQTAAAPAIAFEQPPVRLEPRRAALPKPAPAPARRETRHRERATLSAADVEIFRDAAPELFEPAQPRTGGHLLYVGVGALVMVTLITLGFRWALPSGAAPTTETSAAIDAPAPAAAQPLALVALRNEQSSDGTLVISGVVRNPSDSIGREKLFAAASLVDANGALVASARAPLDFTSLAPGEESPFVVRVANANGVARYRIGFRDAAGAAVAHIDRR
jgi:hypothetical protein